jgi:hypothetical protein
VPFVVLGLVPFVPYYPGAAAWPAALQQDPDALDTAQRALACTAAAAALLALGVIKVRGLGHERTAIVVSYPLV